MPPCLYIYAFRSSVSKMVSVASLRFSQPILKPIISSKNSCDLDSVDKRFRNYVARLRTRLELRVWCHTTMSPWLALGSGVRGVNKAARRGLNFTSHSITDRPNLPEGAAGVKVFSNQPESSWQFANSTFKTSVKDVERPAGEQSAAETSREVSSYFNPVQSWLSG